MKNKEIINKIIIYIEKIEQYTNNLDYESSSQNLILIEACIFNLSQIGGLSSKIDTGFEENYKDIPWREMYGLRNRIVHDYEGINLILIWEIIKNDFGKLKEKLKNIL